MNCLFFKVTAQSTQAHCPLAAFWAVAVFVRKGCPTGFSVCRLRPGSSMKDHLPCTPWWCWCAAWASSIARWTLCSSVNPAEYPEEAPAYLLKTKWHFIRSHRTKPPSFFCCLASMSLKNRPVLPSFQTIKHRPLLRLDLGSPFPSPHLISKEAVVHQERGSKGGYLLFSVGKLLLSLGVPNARSNCFEQLVGF